MYAGNSAKKKFILNMQTAPAKQPGKINDILPEIRSSRSMNKCANPAINGSALRDVKLKYMNSNSFKAGGRNLKKPISFTGKYRNKDRIRPAHP